MSSEKRHELLRTLNDAYRDLEELVEQAGDARMVELGVTGEWSIRDLLAHMTAWEERVVAWAEALGKGTEPAPAPWSKDMNEEQVNAFIYESNRSRSLEDVLERWREVHQRVVKALQEMSERDLFERKIAWLGDQAFADAIPGNSYEHQIEHAQQIRAWLDEKE